MKSHNEIGEIKKKLVEAYTIISGKPRASHEDVRGALSKTLEYLGYPEKNRLHERASKAGKCDLRLITDEGLIHAIVEFKKPGAPFEKDKLRDYMYDLRVRYGIFTDGKILKMYELVVDDLKELGRTIYLGAPDETEVAVLYRMFRKPRGPLTPDRLLDFLGGIEQRPIPLAENVEEFVSKFRLSPTLFAELVSSTFFLYKSEAANPNSFAVKTFKIWKKYFAPTLKEKGGEKRFKEWRERLKIVLGKKPTASELYEYMFALETSYALVSRLILLRVCGDYGFGTGVAWMKDLVREIVKDSLLKALVSSGLYTYVAGQIPRQFERLSYDFPSVFEEDFFDWWYDTIFRPPPPIEDVIRGNIPKPVSDFAFSLLKVTLIVLSFSFKDVTSDILGMLYQEYFDTSTRKALGEFYTPPEIVEYILDSVGYTIGKGISEGKTLIDPACGSGTFLIKALDRHFKEAGNQVRQNKMSWGDVLTNLCDGLAVCGLDINPFAVIIAQVNYSMQIIPFYKTAREKNSLFRISGLPIFKTDTLHLPVGRRLLLNEPLRIWLPIGDQEKIEFLVPTMQMLRNVGALNPAEAVKLLRLIYRAARRAALSREDLDTALALELDHKVCNAVKSDQKLMVVIKSIAKCLKNLKDRVGDGRIMKWVRDELIVATLKSEMKYDYAVFNPPYVTAYRIAEEQWIEYEKYGYELLKRAGKRDLAYLFLEWSLKRLNKEGKLGCIITDKWIEWEGRKKIRNFVVNNAKVIEIIDSMWVKFFEEARNYVAIVTLEKTKEWESDEPLRFASTFKEPMMKLQDSLNEIRNQLNTLEVEYMEDGTERGYVGQYYVANVWSPSRIKGDHQSKSNVKPWSPLFRLSPKEFEVVEELENIGKRLKDIEDFVNKDKMKIFEGIVTAGYPIFLLDENDINSLMNEFNVTTRHTAEGTDVERWRIIYKQRGTKETLLQPCGGFSWKLLGRTKIVPRKRIIFPYELKNHEWTQVDLMNFPLTLNLAARKAKEVLEAIKKEKKGKRVEDAVNFLESCLNDGKLYFIDKRKGKYIERKPMKTLSFKTPRIICRDAARWNPFALDLDAETFPVHTCNFLALKNKNVDKALYYLGLLNSSVMEFYHKSYAPTLAGATFRYRAETVHKYPLITYDVADADIRNKVAKLVKELMMIVVRIKDTVLILQDFVKNPVEASRNYVNSSIDFSATERIEINLHDFTVKFQKPIRKGDEEKLRRYLTETHDRIADLTKILCGKEQKLNNIIMQLYGLRPNDVHLINAFLERLRLW